MADKKSNAPGSNEGGRKRRGRPPGNPSTLRVSALVRQRQAIELKAAGATYEQIGERLGVSNKTAYYDVQAAAAELDAETKQIATRWLEIELRTLDRTQLALTSALQASEDPKERAAVANAVTRVLERRAKLLGLDAATRVEHSGAGGGPVEVVSYEGLSDAELARRAEIVREVLRNSPRGAPGGPTAGDLPAAYSRVSPDPVAAYEAALARRNGGNGSGGHGT